MSSLRLIALVAMAGTAAADPTPVLTVTPSSKPLVLTPVSLFDVPQPIVPSLRLEAARVANERYQDTWRYPDQEALIGTDGNGWFLGVGHYRPRTRRSAALHAGSMGATMLGEILLATDSPLAGLGALATGATLDAAAADADRDAEAARKR